MVLCWATFIAILGHVQPRGLRLDTPDSRLLMAEPSEEKRREGACQRLTATLVALSTKDLPQEAAAPLLSSSAPGIALFL